MNDLYRRFKHGKHVVSKPLCLCKHAVNKPPCPYKPQVLLYIMHTLNYIHYLYIIYTLFVQDLWIDTKNKKRKEVTKPPFLCRHPQQTSLSSKTCRQQTSSPLQTLKQDFITSERIERISYQQSHICSLDDIQTALKKFYQNSNLNGELKPNLAKQLVYYCI